MELDDRQERFIREFAMMVYLIEHAPQAARIITNLAKLYEDTVREMPT
jgi:hypothetical protein